MESGRADEAIGLAERFYLMFPQDNPVARVYIGLLENLGLSAEAQKTFIEFKKRLWREHRLKPSFSLK